jgi:hypothetical protein
MLSRVSRDYRIIVGARPTDIGSYLVNALVPEKVASQNHHVVSRFTAGPAINEAVIAIQPKSRIEPKAGVKLPVYSKRKPINGGPKSTVGMEIRLTKP